MCVCVCVFTLWIITLWNIGASSSKEIHVKHCWNKIVSDCFLLSITRQAYWMPRFLLTVLGALWSYECQVRVWTRSADGEAADPCSILLYSLPMIIVWKHKTILNNGRWRTDVLDTRNIESCVQIYARAPDTCYSQMEKLSCSLRLWTGNLIRIWLPSLWYSAPN